jgi:amidase
MTQIHELTMIELAAAIRTRAVARRRHRSLSAPHAGAQRQVGAFYTVTAELAAEQAAAAEKAVTQAADPAELPPLTGVPIPIKDLNMVAGVRQTLGSLAYENNVPDTDDYVVTADQEAGVVITGKTATPEFGLPCYTETKIGPPARTPWDLSRSAGGSSGGAAAAVAAGWLPPPRAATAAGRSASPPASAGCSGSSRPAAGSPAARSSPTCSASGVERPHRPDRGRRRAAAGRDGGQLPRRHVHPAAAATRRVLPRLREPPAGPAADRPYPAEPGRPAPRCTRTASRPTRRPARLLASLGHEVEDIAMPLGQDLVPFFEDHGTPTPRWPRSARRRSRCCCR